MNPYSGMPVWAVLLSIAVTCFGLWVIFGYYFYLRDKWDAIPPPKLYR